MANKVYIMENLGCAHCAGKIEAEVRKLPQVQEAVMVFAFPFISAVTSIHSFPIRRKGFVVISSGVMVFHSFMLLYLLFFGFRLLLDFFHFSAYAALNLLRT